jgi:lambda family phage minor tail protein L
MIPESQKLGAGSIVELFELDASVLGGEIFRWSNHVNELGLDVTWQGELYSRMPIEAGGFAKSGSGKQARPTLRAANVTGLLGAVTASLDDLVSSKVTRRRTFYKYLDAVNFEGGVNPLADPNVFFPDEIYYVDRKAAENGVFIEFDLASAMDLNGVKLPARQAIQNVCAWQYRSAECSYAGGAVADASDTPTSDITQDKCGKRVSSCKLRFGQNNELPYGGFSGVGRL